MVRQKIETLMKDILKLKRQRIHLKSKNLPYFIKGLLFNKKSDEEYDLEKLLDDFNIPIYYFDLRSQSIICYMD